MKLIVYGDWTIPRGAYNEVDLYFTIKLEKIMNKLTTRMVIVEIDEANLYDILDGLFFIPFDFV